jgi:predicted type IV restriction endonuclease
MVGISPADAAYDAFHAALDRGDLKRFALERLSESDTRAKLIDPLFRDVLGWPEAEIRREKPVASGFVDYVLGADFSYVLVEAKRSNPRFKLRVENKARRLKLGGPHLLGDKKLRPFLEQARNYAVDLGAQFALLTNGAQFILFQPYLAGRSWEHGVAIVFHDLSDIRDDFQEFYALLSWGAVCSGAIIEAFERLEGITSELFRPMDFIQNPDAELVPTLSGRRCRTWLALSLRMYRPTRSSNLK